MKIIGRLKLEMRVSKSRRLTLFASVVVALSLSRNCSLLAADDAKPASAAAIDPTGEDWPIFLGPTGDGVSKETGLAATWPKGGPPMIWSKEVGTGYSAPSVLGNRLVVHHRLRREEVIECVSADQGVNLWKFAYKSEFSDPYGYNNGPRCTPLLTADRCYTYGAEGMLYCLNLENGQEVWHHDTKTEFDLPEWFFGVGATPILEGELLIVAVGGQPNSGLVAFNAATGKIVWQHVGKETWDGADTHGEWRTPTYRWRENEKVVSYSSPLAATIHGKRHILCLMRQGLVSVDPRDGSENFKYFFRSTLNDSVNAARPVVIGDRIFISSAYEVGSAMLQVAADGKSVKELWRNVDNMQTHWSTAIVVDGFIYGFSGRHENDEAGGFAKFRCLEAETGKVVWETDGFSGNVRDLRRDEVTREIINVITNEKVPFPYYGRGSAIRVEDKFIVLGERGTLALVKINPQKFEEISRASYRQIQAPSWAAPVLSRKRLYLRSEEAVICVDVAPQPEKPQAASP